MRTRIGCAVLAAAVALFVPAAARADAFVITDPLSFITFDFEGDFFRLSGHDFVFTDSGGFGVFVHRTMGPVCSPCEAGDPVNPSFQTPDDTVLLGEGTGAAVVGGTTYDEVTFRGSLNVAATPLSFPDTNDPFVFLQTPFSLTGFVRGFVQDTEVFSGPLAGSGTAFIPYFLSNGQYIWEENRADYRFLASPEPVPEPATMLLLGTGLAGVAAARSRRRRTE